METTQTTLRLPGELMALIKRLALQKHRTFNSQIVHMLYKQAVLEAVTKPEDR